MLSTHPSCDMVEFGSGTRQWVSSAIYANPMPLMRKDLWLYLEGLGRTLNLPCVLLGDFNEVLLPLESRCGSFIHSRQLSLLQFWRIVVCLILEPSVRDLPSLEGILLKIVVKRLNKTLSDIG